MHRWSRVIHAVAYRHVASARPDLSRRRTSLLRARRIDLCSEEDGQLARGLATAGPVVVDGNCPITLKDSNGVREGTSKVLGGAQKVRPSALGFLSCAREESIDQVWYFTHRGVGLVESSPA